MKRRDFLQAGLASTGITLVAQGGSHRSIAATQNPKRLIVIFLRGAVDGLNIVVPYRETDYYESRPTIALAPPGKPNGLLDLDGQFGLNPALASILPLWQQGNLAFIHSAGSPEASRSHFEAQDTMERGTPDGKRVQSGWMNRLLSSLSSNHPIQAINVGNVTPKILSGRMSVATLASGRKAGAPIVLDNPNISAAFDRLYNKPDPLSKAYREGRTARKAILDDLEAEMQMANNGASSTIGFSSDAQRLAQIMRNDPRVSLAFMALGGWDTHVNQASSLTRNLTQLGQGLKTLQTTLGKTYETTTILVMSEFGRTIQENGTKGTDHGHGNVMWLMGGGVNGGKVHGDWRGLARSQRYENRDLAVTTDFRDVIATILEHHLQLPDTQLTTLLPGYQPLQRNLSLYR